MVMVILFRPPEFGADRPFDVVQQDSSLFLQKLVFDGYSSPQLLGFSLEGEVTLLLLFQNASQSC